MRTRERGMATAPIWCRTKCTRICAGVTAWPSAALTASAAAATPASRSSGAPCPPKGMSAHRWHDVDAIRLRPGKWRVQEGEGLRTAHELDVVVGAEPSQLRPLALRMELTLIDMRHHRQRRVVDDLLDVRLHVVADADRSDLARGEQLLHRPPALLPLGAPTARPVDQVQIQVVHAEALEGGCAGGEGGLVAAGGVELGGDEELLARHAGLAHAGAHLLLVAVCGAAAVVRRWGRGGGAAARGHSGGRAGLRGQSGCSHMSAVSTRRYPCWMALTTIFSQLAPDVMYVPSPTAGISTPFASLKV